ncbi:hypothetical protein CW745_10410 [Psychromonas sp. psych-6C06]|uniref:methyltransferase domain-containing protein n=1 Tax=Psychromonas sp. psych-6C06 TaxID=2058089 RepID=UPI000C33056B|nr:class I SAM-dependent methyltransferase [Psychromonas sp. psych-6C06]PKF61723.1 hypothetical protein CW745_10410 [Psychromonas sp. psych-6C06]
MDQNNIWKPSKFIYKNERLVASKDTNEVGIGSRLIANIIAEVYQNNLKYHAKGNLLDLGCGQVPLFEAYRGYISDNTCVDWGGSLHRNEYLDLEHDLTKPLPFGDGLFDTIILSDVLEHIPEPERLFSELFRVLSPNGKLILNVPFYYWIHEQPNDYYRYTEFALKRFVERSSLTLIKLESIGGVPEILADILAKNLLRIPIFGKCLSSFLQWATIFFIRTRIGRKVSNRTKNTFPLGYFLVAQK